MQLRSQWMMALAAAGWLGCTNGSTTTAQVVTGAVTDSDAIAVRAVVGDAVITATQVRTDGTFTLSLPAAAQAYRLEVLSSRGVEHVIAASGADLSFRVCQPQGPFDTGDIGPDGIILGSDSGSGDGHHGGSGMGGGGCGGGGMGGPPGGPGGPGMGGPDGSGGHGPDGNSDGSGAPRGTDPMGNTCQPAPAPCADPSDPDTCQDPCVNDASSCGCATTDPSCWPAPGSDAGSDGAGPDPVMPTHPPGDFGCGSDSHGSDTAGS